MGDLYHDGRVVGGNSSIDDSDVDLHKTWSSKKVSDEIDARIAENKTTIKSVRYTIPAGTGTNTFAYPTGFNLNNCIFIGAKIHTKYDSWVYETYNNPNMNYWGDIIFKNDNFQYIPYSDGNATEIIFTFVQI